MKTVIEMAREACMIDIYHENPKDLERFAALVREDALINAKVSIPTNTMEQEFARHYDRGFEAGKATKREKEQEQDPVVKISGYYWVGANVPLSKVIYNSPPVVIAAVLAEREACAKVCESEEFAVWETGERIAAAIRARGDK